MKATNVILQTGDIVENVKTGGKKNTENLHNKHVNDNNNHFHQPTNKHTKPTITSKGYF